jgi:hypothetical protein
VLANGLELLLRRDLAPFLASAALDHVHGDGVFRTLIPLCQIIRNQNVAGRIV